MGYKTSSKTFNDVVRESGWTPEHGDYPGYFKDRDAGERCIWSRNWICPDGVLWSSSIAPQDVEGLKYELRDLAERGDRYAYSLLADKEPNEHAIRVHLEEARRYYGDFFCWPFEHPGKNVGAIMRRPGWALLQDLA